MRRIPFHFERWFVVSLREQVCCTTACFQNTRAVWGLN